MQSIRTKINGRVYEYNSPDDLRLLWTQDLVEAVREHKPITTLPTLYRTYNARYGG